MANQETEYYRDSQTLITNARAVLGAKTYSMVNITSVSTHITPPNRTLGIILAFVGAIFTGVFGLLLLVQIVGIFSSQSFSLSEISKVIGNVVGTGIFLILLILGILSAIRSKPTYFIRIGSASGESDALYSKDKEYIVRVVKAINEAIVKRG